MVRSLLRTYDGVEEFGEHLLHGTVRAIIESHRDSEEPYLRYYEQADLKHELTFGAFSRAVRHVAKRLADRYGVTAGSVVPVIGGNRPETLLVYAATLYLDAAIVPINPAENAEFIRFVIDDVAPTVIFHDPGFSLPSEAASLASESLGPSLWASDDSRESIEAWAADLPAADRRSLATIIYTSGTTGRSKGVRQTQGNWLINAEASRRLHAMDDGHVQMCVLPVFHVNGFGYSFIGCLYAGARLVLNRTLYPLGYWRIVRDEQVTHLSCVPSVLDVLTRSLRRPLKDPPPSVKYATSGAAPLSQQLVRLFMERTGYRVVQVYGMSEATNFDLTQETDLSDADYHQVMFGRERTSAGTPVFGMDLAILRPDGALAEEGETGEVVMRGWAVAEGYHNFPEGTAEVFRADWLHSGDLGYYQWLQGRKYFYLVGRLKEMAKRYGESISLIDIDQRLADESGFEEAVAVAFPNDAAGEEIGLYLVPNERTPDDADALRRLRAVFPEHRRPKIIVRGEAVPKTSTGKIRRRSLSDLFDAHRATVFTE